MGSADQPSCLRWSVGQRFPCLRRAQVPRSKRNYYASAFSSSLSEVLWVALTLSFLSLNILVFVGKVCICLIRVRVLFEIKGPLGTVPVSLPSGHATHTYTWDAHSSVQGQWLVLDSGGGKGGSRSQAAGCTRAPVLFPSLCDDCCPDNRDSFGQDIMLLACLCI